jgi:hypothetical protein
MKHDEAPDRGAESQSLSRLGPVGLCGSKVWQSGTTRLFHAGFK